MKVVKKVIPLNFENEIIRPRAENASLQIEEKQLGLLTTCNHSHIFLKSWFISGKLFNPKEVLIKTTKLVEYSAIR